MATRKRRDLTLVPTTDAELTQAAAVTPADVLRAGVQWEQVAPREFKDVLRAVVAPEDG